MEEALHAKKLHVGEALHAKNWAYMQTCSLMYRPAKDLIHNLSQVSHAKFELDTFLISVGQEAELPYLCLDHDFLQL